MSLTAAHAKAHATALATALATSACAFSDARSQADCYENASIAQNGSVSSPPAALDLSSLTALGTDSNAPSQPRHFQRLMGNTELSYYLPSRADGVNDMYLHLGFRAPRHLFAPRRVLTAWALLLLRHPPLAAAVVPPSRGVDPFHTDYSNAKFSYTPPVSTSEALEKAASLLILRKGQSKDELIDQYLNGDRILGDNRLSSLILSETTSSPDQSIAEYDILVCAVHFLGDGMALHRFANELFTLLAGVHQDETLATEDFEEQLQEEWETRWGPNQIEPTSPLPPPVEDNLPPVTGRFRKAAVTVDFMNSSRKDIGGHTLPKAKGNPRKTLVPTTSFDETATKAILKRCKANGVSISNALFSLSALAWSRVQQRDRPSEFNAELPLMLYSALNLRPYLRPCDSSYWFVSVGFFNIILPAFLPRCESQPTEKAAMSSMHSTFWYRARLAKVQSARAAKNPLLVPRTRETAKLRSDRAQRFAAEDDAKELGLSAPPVTRSTPSTIVEPSPAPSAALLGLSLLGNLDGMYMHKAYPAIQLHTLTTGSRQREGAALVFGYTFVGKLWLSLGYDVNGFKEGVVEAWWKEVLSGVNEFLID